MAISRYKVCHYGLLTVIGGNCCYVINLCITEWKNSISGYHSHVLEIYNSFIFSEIQDLGGDVVQNLSEFFRTMYKKVFVLIHDILFLDAWGYTCFQFCGSLIYELQVTEADIEEFEANYRGSDSEKKDLIDLYKKCKGNMDR